MSNEIQFIDGLIVKAPNEKAPDYVKAKLSIKREQLIAWLSARSGEWINADIKVSQAGKWYAAVDDWKPNAKQDRQESAPQPAKADKPTAGGGSFDFEDEIPFAQLSKRTHW